MDNSFFPLFSFQPTKLGNIHEKLREKYEKYDEDLLEHYSVKRLPDLLNQIRQLEDAPEVIQRFAQNLKKQDAKVLAYAYPYKNEETEITLKKIIDILKFRYEPMIGRLMWVNFHSFPQEKRVVEFFQNIFNRREIILSSMDEFAYEELSLFFSSANLSEAMAKHILVNALGYEEALKNWRVRHPSQWAKLIDFYLLKNGLTRIDFINREGPLPLEKRLSEFKFKDYKELILGYLDAFGWNEYHNNILEQAIQKLGNPNKNTEGWRSFPDLIVEKVKRWEMIKRLKRFFEDDPSERFRFWGQYADYFVDVVDEIKDPPIIIISFGSFLVVEFANVGNAAYFYDPDRFMSKMYPRIMKRHRRLTPESFKDKEASYFLNALHHRGNWYYRFDDYIQHYLRGDFNYDHRRGW